MASPSFRLLVVGYHKQPMQPYPYYYQNFL